MSLQIASLPAKLRFARLIRKTQSAYNQSRGLDVKMDSTAKVLPSEVYSHLLQANASLQGKEDSTIETKEFANQLLNLLQPIVVELDKYRSYQQQLKEQQTKTINDEDRKEGEEKDGKDAIDGSESILLNNHESVEFAALVLDTVQTLLAQEPVISLIANNRKTAQAGKNKESLSQDSSSLLGLLFGTTTDSSAAAAEAGDKGSKEHRDKNSDVTKDGEKTSAMTLEDDGSFAKKEDDDDSKSPGNNIDAMNISKRNKRTSWLEWVSPTLNSTGENTIMAKMGTESEAPAYPWVAEHMNLKFVSSSSTQQQRPPPPPLVDSSPLFGGWFGTSGGDSSHSKHEEGDKATQPPIPESDEAPREDEEADCTTVPPAPDAFAHLSPPLQRKSWHSSLVPWFTSVDDEAGNDKPQKLEILVRQNAHDGDEFGTDASDISGNGQAVYDSVAKKMHVSLPTAKTEDLATNSESDENPLVRDKYQQKLIERDLQASKEFKEKDLPNEESTDVAPADNAGKNKRSSLLSVVDWILPASSYQSSEEGGHDDVDKSNRLELSNDENAVYPWVTAQMQLTYKQTEPDNVTTEGDLDNADESTIPTDKDGLDSGDSSWHTHR